MKTFQTKFQTHWRSGRGFSLFELVVFIIVVAIIYAAAARRFSEFPGEAERANFLAVATQIQTGINLEMMIALTRGQTFSVADIEQYNPMDLLLDPPSNYIGEFDFVDTASIERRVWYFDLNRNELVYLINDNEGVFLDVDGRLVPTQEIRFKIQAVYSGQEAFSRNTDSAVLANDDESLPAVRFAGNSSVSGLLLTPVIPYQWNTDIMELAGSGILDS